MDLYNFPNEWKVNGLYDLRVPQHLRNEFWSAGKLYVQAKFVNLHQRGVDRVPEMLSSQHSQLAIKQKSMEEYITGKLFCNVIRVRGLVYPRYLTTYPGVAITIENWAKSLIIPDKHNPNIIERKNIHDDHFEKKIKFDLYKKRCDKYPVLFPLQTPKYLPKSHHGSPSGSLERKKHSNKKPDYKMKVTIWGKDVPMKNKAAILSNIRLAIDGEEVTEKTNPLMREPSVCFGFHPVDMSDFFSIDLYDVLTKKISSHKVELDDVPMGPKSLKKTFELKNLNSHYTGTFVIDLQILTADAMRMVDLVGSMPSTMYHSESIDVLQSASGNYASKRKLAANYQNMWIDSPCDKINIPYDEFFEPASMEFRRKDLHASNKKVCKLHVIFNDPGIK